ncbi:MAG TPA: ABC transporter substrate-binding protein [Rubrobacter sp.]|nr:ABC transporter substrate-binding protein [Rubrobacter sp.]
MDRGYVGGKRVRRVSRRRFLYGAATALGGMALASCSGGPFGGSRETVHFWNLFGGGDGARLADMESDYVESHPGIDLKATTLTWGAPYYTKLSMSTVGGRPPDVAVMHLTRLPAYAPAGLLEPLDPDVLSEYGIGPDRFLPEIWEAGKYDGEVYAIPLDTHPQVMYYNTDICKKAGLLDSDGNLKPLVGREELIDAFQKTKEITKEQGISFAPADSVIPWRLFYSFYGQLGGEVLSPDADEVVLDQEKAEEALAFLVELTVDKEFTPSNQDYAAAVAQFQSGNAGFHWNGEWEVTTFLDAKMPFSMAEFPNVFGNKRVQADRHTFVIPKGIASDHKAFQAALQFVSSMLESSLIWAEGGHIPAYRSVLESSKYKNLKPQSNYAGVADKVVLDPKAWFSGSGSDMEVQVSVPMQQAMAGGLDTKEAVKQIRAALQELVDTPKPF